MYVVFRKKVAFTLIEMLIVIVIIGILAAALVPRLADIQWRARDTKRKADLSSMVNALEIYFADYGSYPLQADNTYRASYQSQPWISELSGIMTSLPVDPINNGFGWWPAIWATGHKYLYSNAPSTTKVYALSSLLENTKDPERCSLQTGAPYKYLWNGTRINRCGQYSSGVYVVWPYRFGQ